MLFIFQMEILLFSSIYRDYMSLQAPCLIFVNRSGWLELSLPRSLASDVQIHFIYLTSHTALMLLTFISFCVLNSIMNYNSFHFMFQNLLEVSKS
jgi:hypothetical protein